MAAGTWFWIIYVISLIFCGIWNWPADRAAARPFGSYLIFYLLIGLVGWKLFGPPLQ